MSGHRTPWINSSLTSDRLKPSPPPTRPSSAAKNRGKGKEPQQPPKSVAVRKLETLIKKLQTQSGADKDAEGGCFCQGALFPSNVLQHVLTKSIERKLGHMNYQTIHRYALVAVLFSAR